VVERLLAKRGCFLFVKFLGHKKVTTTMIYTQVDTDDLRASVEKNSLNNLF